MDQSSVISHFRSKLRSEPAIIHQLLALEGCYLCGGALRDYITKYEPKDYDFFFTNNNALGKARVLLSGKLVVENSYTETYFQGGRQIQLIKKKVYNNAQSIVDDFDFDNVRVAYNYKSWYIPNQFVKSNIQKKVMVHKITRISRALERLKKYKDRDYKVENAFDEIIELIDDHNTDVFYGRLPNCDEDGDY